MFPRRFIILLGGLGARLRGALPGSFDLFECAVAGARPLGRGLGCLLPCHWLGIPGPCDQSQVDSSLVGATLAIRRFSLGIVPSRLHLRRQVRFKTNAIYSPLG